MKVLLVLVIGLMLLTSVATAQRPDPTGQDRYTILPNRKVFDSIPQYKDKTSLDGLGRKQAKDLGVAGKKAWNEYPKGPKLVTLHAEAWIYYDTGSLELYYLDGCIVNGQPRPNRIVLVEKIVEKETVVEKEKIVEVEKIVTKEVQVPGPERLVDKPFSVCPAGFSFKGVTRMTDRLFGGKIQAGVSVAISAGLTAARKGKKEDYIESIVGSLLLQRSQQAFNASQSAVYLIGPGIEPILIKRGKDTPVGTGMEVVWAGNVAALVATYGNQEYTCSAYNLKTASNMGVWTSRTRMQDVIKNIPTKTQTPNQIPTIPGNGNQIPTGPNIPPGFPQVPCRRGANGQCLPPITSTPNTPTTGTNPTPQPQPPIQQPPVNNPVPPRICRPGQPCIQFAPTTTGNTSATNNRQSSTELVKPMVTTKAMSNRLKID